MSARKQRAKRRAKQHHSGRSAARRATHADHFKKTWRWFLPEAGIFAGLKRHGKSSWQPVPLVCLALCWAWEETRNVTDAFEGAATQCRLLGFQTLKTYQGLMKVLVKWTDPLLRLLWPVLHQRMRQIGRGSFWQIGDWVPIAFDGSRSNVPQTKACEKAFSPPNYGKGKTAKYRKKKSKGLRRRRNAAQKTKPQQPQVWTTLLWHMGLRLPWMWRVGPSNSSERQHVMEMLDEGEFPENTLFCGDAGFVGHPLWSRILDRGQHFLVRVGANVHLLKEMNCRRTVGGQVLSWPQPVMKAGEPPLRLRLEQVRIGRSRMWMLTSVLDSSQLTRSQIVKLYKKRWGIEVEFRGLKQTLHRHDLKCRNYERVLVEMHWSLLAMAVAELFALKEQLAGSLPSDPEKRSLANTMRALRNCLKNLKSVPDPGRDLQTRLRHAVTDSYTRTASKQSRYPRRNPDKKPLGDPKIRILTVEEKRALRDHKPEKSAG